MNIRISADSTCDLSPELIEKYDIRITPLYIVRDGQSLVDGKDITPDEIYAHVNSGGGMCSTAAVSVYDYTQFFRRQLEECDAVVHFHISGDMSACYQNACIAAQEVGNVYPVDSRSLSTGIGQLVLEAAQLTREGKLTAQEIAHEMERRRELLDVSFLVERLDFLHKGGRCSGVALLGANMLNLRPCIQVKDGQMMVGKKYRGPYVSCLLQYIRERLKGRDDIDTRRIFITESGGFTPEELAAIDPALRVPGTTLIMGTVDAVLVEGDHAVLLDYKTDRVAAPQELTGRYALQLKLYAAMVRRQLGLPVTEAVLYSFCLGQAVKVEL